MDTSLDTAFKKVVLEELSKEDLIKKCRGLLNIAQKAKQAKDVLLEENSSLKDELARRDKQLPGDTSALEELIESLTQQKLGLVTQLEELKNLKVLTDSKLKECELNLITAKNSLCTLDTENQSYKRQVERLGEENEQLLGHLDKLENEIDTLKKIGLEQQEQLLELEKNKVITNTDETDCIAQQNVLPDTETDLLTSTQGNIDHIEEGNELYVKSQQVQEMQQVIIKLQEDHANLKNSYDELVAQNSELIEKHCVMTEDAKRLKEASKQSDTVIKDLKQQVEAKTEQLEVYLSKTDDLNIELHKNKAMVEKLKQDISNTSNKLSNSQIVSSGVTSDLQNTNEKLRDKLKLYHTKIIKFAGDIKLVKQDRNDILNDFKVYIKQVEIWKKQLLGVSKYLQSDFMRESQLKMESDTLTSERKDNEIDNLNVKLEQLEKENKLKDENIVTLNEQVTSLKMLESEVSNIKENNENLLENNNSLAVQIRELENSVQERIKIIADLNVYNENVNKQLELYKSTETQLAEESRKEITKLVQENNELTEINKNLQQELLQLKSATEKLEKCDFVCQTADASQGSESELEERISVMKRENSELLAEMNEMNQALKERGETISKQQEYCEEVVRKLKIYESQMNKSSETSQQKEELIKKLQQEIAALKNQSQSHDFEDDIRAKLSQKEEEVSELRQEMEKLVEKLNASMETSHDNSYAESDVMSTSTISKTEETNRLKDLEGSWEERYSKLRSFAVKLKGKLRDTTTELTKEQNEKADVQQKFMNNLKAIQNLQAENDKLKDDVDRLKNDVKNYVKNLDLAAQEISNDKKQLAANDESIMKLKSDIDVLNKEKSNTDNWKKQVGAKVQNLKKELEANGLIKKDFENQITKLNTEIEIKEKALKEEMEKHNKTKNSLQELNNECKKQSLLSLEMQDYERSLKDLTQKLDKKQELITKLKNQIDSHKSTSSALKEQNRLLEERIQTEETELNEARNEINAYKKNISDVETLVAQKEDKVLDVTRTLESTRTENEELSTQLSKIIADHQKINNALKSEKEHLRSQNLGLTQRLREVQENLKLKEDELCNVQDEYNGYKVRAQSVLRQNQTRDVGLEEKLREEAATFKAQVTVLSQQIEEYKVSASQMNEEKNKLILEREKLQEICQKLEIELHENQKQYLELSMKHQQASAEYTETIRGLKVHADTLAQCYRKQISEQEVRHNREVIELQSKLDRGISPPEVPPLIVPTMPREEGEGSEHVEAIPISTTHPVPLERLLSNETDQEAITFLRKQILENETKVTHLTALLADTEQDLVKHVQMNKVLKEEIRRQQRSVEREEHAENLEYLKNVVFKFVTLGNGDERCRLVPVLNTILKLSPEETQKLHLVAKSDPGILGWTNYLPQWPSTNK